MKLDLKNKHMHCIQWLLRLTIRDTAPESYQVRPESPSDFLKNENDAIRNRISDFDKRLSQPKIQ